MPLKVKYAFLTSILLVIVLGAFSWHNYLQEAGDVVQDHRERVALLTQVIKNGLVTSMLEGRGREFQRFLEAMVAEDVREVRIFDTNGIILASSLPKEIGQRIYEDDMSAFLEQGEPEVFSHQRGDEREYFSMVVPIFNEPRCQRCHGTRDEIRGVLDVEVSMGRTTARLGQIRLRAFVTFLLTLIVLVAGLFILTSLVVDRPLGAIVRTMQIAREGDLSVRHETGRGDEIGKLAENLNDMLERLEGAHRELEAHHVQQLRKVERMATLGQMASAVAHEIKNPLAGISGAVQVLAGDLPPDDPRHGVIQEVLGEISRLDKSVRDLLAYARPAPPHLIRASLGAVVERTMNILGAEAQKLGVRVSVDMDEKIPDMMIDPDQMHQVFVNLMKNAFQSIPEGRGEIRIAGVVEEDGVRVSFEDNGRGISPEMRNNVFQPFFTTRRAGTGLGLAISKSIVEKHGGTISVGDTPGGGTRFLIELPNTG